MKKKLVLFIVLVLGTLLLLFYLRKSSDKKLYEVMEVPAFEFINEENQKISNKDMLGKVYVVEFFFTNCPTICPVMNQNLKEIDQKIHSPEFGVISITIDPKRDTPEALKTHKTQLKIENPNWHFLTGNRDAIYDLSKKFNIYVGENESTAEGLNHSGKLALVDKNGKIRSRVDSHGVPILYYSGLNYADEEGRNESLGGDFHPQINWLEEDIKKLLNE